MKYHVAMPVFNGNERKYVDECIDTGWISANGRFVREFEEKYAAFCETKYALSFANGTVSLHLALVALGIGAGDEVIMPTFTYIATANTVAYCGAKPVFVDIEPDTWNLAAAAIEEKITPRTKAIMPVHIYGCPCDMGAILEIAQTHGLFVIEDAAEAHGATYKDKKTGTMGIVGSFSFFGNKIITCGEGGMLTTNDDVLYERIKRLKSQGVDPTRRYWHDVVGYNYRMTNMQAAVGLAQLEKIDWHIGQRRRVRSLYEKHLAPLTKNVVLQEVRPATKSVFWMTCILLTEHVKPSRDRVMERMEARGIEMRPAFYPMHIMPPYFEKNGQYPVAENVGARGLCLPSHAGIEESDVVYIVEALRESIEE